VAGPRFHPARILTRLEFRSPAAHRLVTRLHVRRFDELAPCWDGIRGEHTDSTRMLDAVLSELAITSPRRVLDVGTGTGQAAFVLADRFPDAGIDAVDVSPAMIAAAREKDAGGRVTFAVADAGRLPFADGTFDLALALLVMPYPEELLRVLAPGGWAAFLYPMGPGTPIWFPASMIRPRLLRAGFSAVASGSVGPGEWTAGRR
jgi:ubiquinone/menaquinone biosynthesis C-methylase UbiE